MELAERLMAIEDIKRLKARYFRHVDAKAWDDLASLFAADAIFYHSAGRSVRDPLTGVWDPPLAAEPRISRGRATIVAVIRQAVEPIHTVHQGHMPEIEIVDARRATGIWAMSDALYDRQRRLILHGAGHYHETYVRVGDAWLFATIALTRLWLVHGDGTME